MSPTRAGEGDSKVFKIDRGRCCWEGGRSREELCWGAVCRDPGDLGGGKKMGDAKGEASRAPHGVKEEGDHSVRHGGGEGPYRV